MKEKFVYSFSEGNKEMKDLLGGKGANLAEMSHIGLPVPQGFTLTTAACNNYYEVGEKLSDSIKEEVFEKLAELEKITGKNFGGTTNPLLVSVRSGAKISMPGMMDTVLNLGLNDDVIKTLSEESGNPRFVLDSYRRFIQMFSDVVVEIPKAKFERVLDEIKDSKGVSDDTELTEEDLKEVVDRFKKEYIDSTGEEFPQDPREQ